MYKCSNNYDHFLYQHTFNSELEMADNNPNCGVLNGI